MEPACAVARVGHPMVGATDLQLRDLAAQAWILPPPGSVLRHRWELMFRRAALEPPANAVDTAALLLITALLQQTDSLHVMPIEATLNNDVKTYKHRIRNARSTICHPSRHSRNGRRESPNCS